MWVRARDGAHLRSRHFAMMRVMGHGGVTRVCHITTVHPVDDHRILHKECVSLRHAGYDVTLIAPHERNAVVEGIAVVADLYHFHDPDFLPFAVRLARAGKRVVYDAHEDVPTQIRHKEWIPAPARPAVARAFARLEATCVSRLDAVVSPSEPALDRLRPHQPRVVPLPNYPQLDVLAPRAEWGERLRAACYVGGVTRVRGACELVEAMAHADVELHLAGAISPPELAGELERSPGWSRVRYLGRVEHARVPELLARVKVGLIPLHPIPNYVDAYPVKLFEYMAAGLPVIATDVPRWRAVLEAHGCGVCVAPGSPRLLAEAITGLLDNDDRAREMGDRA